MDLGILRACRQEISQSFKQAQDDALFNLADAWISEDRTLGFPDFFGERELES
jgi:hypothetical protein